MVVRAHYAFQNFARDEETRLKQGVLSPWQGTASSLFMGSGSGGREERGWGAGAGVSRKSPPEMQERGRRERREGSGSI